MTVLKKIIFPLVFICTSQLLAQPEVIDKVVGVVGKHIIQYSDIEEQYLQYLQMGNSPSKAMKCNIFEEMLVQKLMVTQAELDSVEAAPGEVEQELDGRIDYFISQMGSEDKLVEHFQKSVLEIKRDMYDAVLDQILTRKMQGEIVKGISITPKEVKDYYKTIPKDSLPYIESQYQISQILRYPSSSEEAIYEVKQKLLDLRKRIIEQGSSFRALAVVYSEGPSASSGGDIGWLSKAELDPEYAKVAFSLKKGQVSKIVESSFGYHIIQLIDKSDERVHTRHILMNPKISIDAKTEAQNKLDSLADFIRSDSLTFEQAANLYSEDEETSMNGGLRINKYTGDTRFGVNDFNSREYYVIKNLKVSEISEAFESVDDNQKPVFKIIKIKSMTPAHTANLDDDFDLLKQQAVQNKQQSAIDKWVTERLKTTYVKLSPPFDQCEFKIEGWTR